MAHLYIDLKYSVSMIEFFYRYCVANSRGETLTLRRFALSSGGHFAPRVYFLVLNKHKNIGTY